MGEKEYYSKEEVDKMIWNLAVATNATIKGLLGYTGAGGSYNKKVIGVPATLKPEKGYENLKEQLISVLKKQDLQDGDVLIFSEKIFAVSQNRLIPFSMILENDPKKMDINRRKDMAKEIEKLINQPVNNIDLILADTYNAEDGTTKATVGVYNPNRVAFEIAQLIKKEINKSVDVIISDTDTGADVCQTLIGCISIGATPLGATKGLCIYECMRTTVSAEFVRGSDRGIPIVICKPIKRHTGRKYIGEYRGYDGRIDYLKEEGIAFENSCK